MLDVDFVRAQFPGLETPWALFDNAGGSVVPRQVSARVREHLERRPVQLGASYALSRDAGTAVDTGRRAAATLIGAPESECALGPSASMLLLLLARALRPRWSPGDEVVVTSLDHEANVGPWRKLEASGIVMREWRLDPETCALRLEDLERLLNARTRLVAFTHCSNVVGALHDVRRITERVRAAGALSCVDGVAFAPHRRVDVAAFGADVYVLSLYKVFGPHLGLLWARSDVLRALESQNHFFVAPDALAAKLEPGNVPYELTASLAGILDYLAAVDRHHGGIDDDGWPARLERVFALFAAHEERLAAPILALLARKRGVRVLGPSTAARAERAPTIAFTVDGTPASAFPPRLDERRIALRYGHFYAYRAIHALGLLEQDGVVRASLAHYNTPAEVERLTEALDELL